MDRRGHHEGLRCPLRVSSGPQRYPHYLHFRTGNHQQYDRHRYLQYSHLCESDPCHLALCLGPGLCRFGKSDRKNKCRHCLAIHPSNILSPLIVQGTVQFAIAILAEAGLSYLGLGTQPLMPAGEGCSMRPRLLWAPLRGSRFFRDVRSLWLVLGFNLLGDGLRDILESRLSRTRMQ